jgi:hypothetical protein
LLDDYAKQKKPSYLLSKIFPHLCNLPVNLHL